MKENPKKNILISFSGGETSAYMLQHILSNYPNHNIKVVFANTGEENEETLRFVQNCSEYFNVDIVWLEYERLSFNVVDFDTAYRSHNKTEIDNKWQNHPFRKYISHFGIPNIQNMTCTREMKEYPINRYLSSIGWTKSKHTKAIGIRVDEIDRVGQYWYPLVHLGITKQMINNFWSNMPFRLELKGYEGNCKTCWKKSDRKLVTIARENPNKFDFFKQMEIEYSDFIRDTRTSVYGTQTFFRDNKSVDNILEMSKELSIKNATDDSKEINYQRNMFEMLNDIDISNGCEDSCEVFA